MISLTIEYALRAMVCLSSSKAEESMNSETIAERTKVPKGYLSKIMRDLVVANLVESQRGPNGGFVLARPASQINILSIVDAVDPINRIRECPLGNPSHTKLCPLHRRLDDSLANIERDFKETLLSEVLESTLDSSNRCKTMVVSKPSTPSRKG
jgi:Rrf2 family nitric oxide-sensitive transcriptional repressor